MDADLTKLTSGVLEGNKLLGKIWQALTSGLPAIALPVTTVNGGTGQVAGVPCTMAFATASGGTIAAGATVFLGPAGSNATEGLVSIPVPYAGTIRNLQAKAGAVPGAGQTFTYTLRKAGASQALTSQTAGAAATSSSDLTHSVAVVAGDVISIQLVTSGAAGVTAHLVSVEFDKSP